MKPTGAATDGLNACITSEFSGRAVARRLRCCAMPSPGGRHDAASPTSPIRPAVPRFSRGKSLSGKERRGPKRRKSAVVPTKSILKAANVPIIGGHHVLALQGSPEGWQATSLLERCREHADRQGARGAAARAVPG